MTFETSEVWRTSEVLFNSQAEGGPFVQKQPPSLSCGKRGFLGEVLLVAVSTEIWRKSPFFSELGEDELAEIASRAHERTFRRGEVILLEGEAHQAA